ncbi:diguanylate cyclase [Arcobacter sp. LA11]|uniref:GGDEF domain-containing response regulator n=1 Tax=Arcobacter sp. LA11 TaxID=1898176 RepID=UPI0009345C80|nr:diguanylate cyclase [Arcobacter sp. LA11]
MKILIADDDPVIRKQLELSLSKNGYEVIQCKNGLEGLEIAKSIDSPSLMLFDWSMPGLTGLELCKQIRTFKREPEPYILLLTSKNDTNDVIEGLDSGANDYITKPFYPHELQARLKIGLKSIKLQLELIKARNMLAIEANHDYLTGILNRRAVMKAFELEIERYKRDDKSSSLALFDLDFFKKVNDTYGHVVGDEVLCEITKKTSSVLRPYDSFGRYGGEEFLLILPDCNEEETYIICERIRKLIYDSKINTSVGLISVSISVGACVFSSNKNCSIEELVKIADDNLYEAKEQGRNCVRFSKF